MDLKRTNQKLLEIITKLQLIREEIDDSENLNMLAEYTNAISHLKNLKKMVLFYGR